MKRFLLTLFYCIGISAFASESFLVHGFNSEREFSQWRAPTGDSTTIKYNTDTNFISEGTGSAFLSFPPKSSGEGLWPRVSSNRVPLNGDWSAYDEFSIDLYNPGPDDVSFRIQLQVEGGGKLGRGWNQLAPGKHSLRAELPEAVKTMKIINIIIYQNQPPVAYSMYIDNYQIHLNKEKLQEKITNFFEDDPGNWKEAGLLNKHQKIAKELKKLKNSKISSIEKAKKVNKLNAEYKALKELRNKNLNELRVKEFAKIFPNNWGYGISHSLEKVFRKDFPYRGKISGPAEIYLARNERESFQVVLRSGQAVSNVKLSVSDLVLSTDSRVRISSDSIKIYPVGFIKAAKPPYPREELEWYPDPLLNFMDSFNLDANVWQAIWVDVRTSSSTPAGLYLGNITVNGDNVTELSIPVLVNVWDFALPKQNSLPVAIAHGSPQGFYKKNVPEADIEKIIIDAEDMLLRHRITPSPIYNSRYAVSPEEALRWQKAGGKEYNISYIQPVPAQTNEAYPEWVRKRVLNIMKEAIPKLRDAGVLQDAYIYTFDEITAERFYSAQTILKEIKQLYPEVPIATTAFDPTFGIESGLEDCIDIWIPSERSYVKNRERIDEIRKQGKKSLVLHLYVSERNEFLIGSNCERTKITCRLEPI